MAMIYALWKNFQVLERPQRRAADAVLGLAVYRRTAAVFAVHSGLGGGRDSRSDIRSRPARLPRTTRCGRKISATRSNTSRSRSSTSPPSAIVFFLAFVFITFALDFRPDLGRRDRAVTCCAGSKRTENRELRMSRANAIARAHAYFDSGGFLADLSRRVAIPSSSQEPERAAVLRTYLDGEIAPALGKLGFTCRVLDNPARSAGAGRRAHRKSRFRHRAGLWPRRHHSRARRSVAARTIAMARRRRGRAHLRPRHRRQQRPAQRQYRGARSRAGATRRARLQLQDH